MHRIENSKNLLGIINYHYCYANSFKIFQGLNGVKPEDFNLQIHKLNEKFNITTLRKIFNKDYSQVHNKPKVCITFDDGTKDFIDCVYPILSKYNIKVNLYISSLPYTEKKIMNVHKIHLLQAKLGFKLFHNIFYEKLNDIYKKKIILDDIPLILSNNLYRYDDKKTKKFKTLLNYQLPYSILSDLLSSIFVIVFNEKEEDIVDKFYLSNDDINFLIDKGFEIGAHSSSHPVLSRLNSNAQHNEIIASANYFRKKFDIPELSFAYPYGLEGTYNNDTIKILSECPYIYSAVTMKREPIKNISNKNLYEIPRYDNNDVFDNDNNLKNNLNKLLNGYNSYEY